MEGDLFTVLSYKIIKTFILLFFLTTLTQAQYVPFAFHAVNTSGSSNKHYYVSSEGSDLADGSIVDPFLTLNKISTLNLQPYDTVSFKGGETIYGSYSDVDSNIFTSGSGKIVFNSYGTGKATLRPNSLSDDKHFYLQYFNTLIKYEFKSLIFQGYYNAETGTDSLNQYGLYVMRTSFSSWTDAYAGTDMYLVVDSCEFTGYETTGLTLLNRSFYIRGYFRVTNNNFHDLGLFGYNGEGMCHSDFKIDYNSFTNIHGKANNTNSWDYVYGFRQIFSKKFSASYNYVNNLGKYSSGACGLYTSASVSIKFSRNEVRNVMAPTFAEGVGIYPDCNTDSILVENNYIQNCYTGVFGSAGFSGGCGPPAETGVRGFVIDSTGSYGNIVRYNIIVSDSTGRNGVIMYSSDSAYRKFPKNNFIYNNLIYAKSGYKNLDTAAGRYITAGIQQIGWQESLYVYNNIFVLDSAHAFDTQPTTYNNPSGRNLNATIKNNLYYTVNGDSDRMNAYVKNGWTMTTSFHWYRLVYPSLMVFADSTGYEKSGVNYLYTHADPKIKNVLARLYGTTAKINPVYLDTLTNFKAQMYSAGYQRGVNYNSVVKRFGDTATTDFYGAAIKYPAPDIGINNIPTPSGTGGDTTNYYVNDSTGNDFYSGNSTTYPFKTLSKLNSIKLDPGDSVFLKGGQTFHGQIRHLLTYNDTVNALTFTSYGTGKPTILLGTKDSMGIGIEFTKHAKITIRNIKVQGIYNPSTETGGFTIQYGISVWNYAYITPIDSNKISQVNIVNCEVSNIKSGGIGVTPGDYGKTITAKIDSNLVYNCGNGAIAITFNWHSNSRIYGNVVRDIYGLSGTEYTYSITVSLCKDIAIERNLIYNIGGKSSISGLGITTGASKNIRIRYNEIYNIVNTSAYDAEAIDLENGSDSCLVEYNYIHSTPGMGILISSNSSDSSIIKNYKAYATLRGGIDSGSSDYNIVRYNLMKNLSSTDRPGLMGIKVASGAYKVSIPGKNNQIYNNTIIYPNKRTSAYGLVFNGRCDSTKFFNNLIIADSLSFILHDTTTTKTNTFFNNNIYWDRGKALFNFIKTTSGAVSYNIHSLNSESGWESTKLLYNPLLANPFSLVGDTLNNPWLIENLRSRYTPTQGSIVTSQGANITNYIRTAPTTDISGAAAKTSNIYGIGAFNDTTNYGYTFQLETKRLLGRDTNLISQTDKYIKDSLILGLKTDTLWSKMEAFYILATPNEFSGKLNAIKDSGNMVMAGTIQFFPYEGFKNNGNGGYGYLNSFFGFGTGALYTLNNASIGVYSRTDSLGIGRTVNNQYEIFAAGSGYYTALRLNTNISNYVSAWINDANFGYVINNGSTAGLFTSNRVTASGSGAVVVYKNGTSIGTISSTSSVIPNANFCIFGAPAYGSPNDSNVSRRQLSFAFFGAALTAPQNINLANRVEVYLDRYGKGVITNNRAYYVDAIEGNDGNTGTLASPYQTISKVNSLILIPGDTVKFKGGTTFTDTTLIIGEAGTAIAPIVFTSYNGSRATFTRSLDKGIYLNNGVGGIEIRSLNINGNYNSTTQSGSDTSVNHLGISGFDYYSGVSNPAAITIDSVTITGFKQAGIDLGADSTHGYSNITIKNNIISDCGIAGIKLWGVRYKTILVQNNKIYNIRGRDGIGPTVNYGFSGSGISLSFIRNATITRNLIYNCGANADLGTVGIVSGTAKNLIVSYNEIYGIKAPGGIDGDGIDFDNGSDSNRAEYNYIHNNDGNGVLISGTSIAGASDYNIIRYNLFKNNGLVANHAVISIYQENGSQPTGNIIQNNIMVSKKVGANIPIGIRFHARTNVNTKIKNNIILGDSCDMIKADSSTYPGLVIQGNTYWDKSNTYYKINWGVTAYTNLVTWQNATGQEKNGATSVMLKYNPLLNNPWTTKDTINNPYSLDTLTNYKFSNISLMKDFGVKSDSTYLWSANTTDFYGNIVPKNTLYDIGAYEDTTTVTTYAYNLESKRYFGRSIVSTTINNNKLIDSLFTFLKIDTLFNTKYDALYILANIDTNFAKLNIIKDTSNITSPLPPTFTVFQGYTGNGSSTYLSTNFTPSTGINYLLDSSSISLYSVSGGTINGYPAFSGNNGGGPYVRLTPSNGANLVTAINDLSAGPGLITANTNGIGFFHISRYSSGSYLTSMNDTIYPTLNQVSTSRPSVPLFICANDGAGGPNNYSTFKIGFASAGGKLSTYQMLRINDNIGWYLNRVGLTILPSRPLLLSPASAVTVMDSDTTLSWSALNNRSSYHLQVSTTANFSSFFKNDSGLTSTTYNLTGLSTATTYYWRVRAKNSAGLGVWSLTNNFTTSAILNRYYVDATGGNDGNTGTIGSPYQTIAKVNSLVLKPGDTVSFKGGETFNGVYSDTDSNIFTTISNKIVFNSYGSGKATIRPTNSTNSSTFFLTYTNQIKYEFKNLIFRGYYNSETCTDSLNQYGIFISCTGIGAWNSDYGGSDMYLVVDSCEFTGYHYIGLTINNNSYYRRGYFRVTNNNFHDLGKYGYQGNGMNYCDFKIENNRFTNIHGKLNDNSVNNDYAMAFRQIWSRDFSASYNYINNIGKYSSGGCGLYVASCNTVKFSKNEIRNVYGPTYMEGTALYADYNTDSIIYEYNYIQNCYNGIFISAGYLPGGGPIETGIPGYAIDSTPTSSSIARYNIIISDSIGRSAFITYNTDDTNYAKNNFIYNNLIYLNSSYSVVDTSMGRFLTAGILVNGFQESLYVFNNIFILDSAHAFDSPPSTYKHPIGQSKNFIVKNNLYYTVNGDSDRINAYIKYAFSNTPIFHWLRTTFPSMTIWADSTGFEKHGGSYTYIHADPKIKNILARLYGTTAEIGPHNLDTLNNFKAEVFSYGYKTGVNYNSIIKLHGDTATVDFYGDSIKYPTPDIGINNIPAPVASGGDTTNYYVDPLGNDNYDGHTILMPFKTTTKLNTIIFNPGDTIFFKGGETFSNTNLVISQSGTNTNPIVINSYNGSRATLSAPIGPGIYIYNGKGGVVIKNLNIVGDYNSVTQSGSDTTTDNSGIKIFNIPATVVAPSIIIDSCLITGFKQTGIGLGADTISKGYDSLRIRNCVIHNIGIIGIKAFALRNSDFTITNNRIYNIRGRDGAGIESVFGYSGAGISVGGIWGMTITRNLIYNCGEYADQGSTGIVTGDCKRIICSYNEVYGVKAALVDGDAIDYDNNTDSSIVEYNYLHNCDGAGVMLSGLPSTGSSDNNIIRYNIIKNCGLKGGYPAILIFQAAGSLQPTGNIIHNNTTVSKKTGTSNPAGIMLSGRSTINTRIKNNILLGDSVKQIVLDSAVQTGLVIQGNCYWDKRNIYYNIKWGGTTYTNLSNWRITSGQETSGGNSTMLIYNPLLNNPFTLRDTINNPYAIDTMTNYKYVDASLLRDAGVKTDSSYLWSANTRDFYGGIVPETSIYDIGAYEDTVTTTYTYSSYSKRLLSRDTNMVNQQDRHIKDSLIAGLVMDTIWSKLDLFYIMAAPNQYAAKFNAIKDTFNLSAISSPTFTAYEGFTGNGISSYLSTTWTPSTNAVNYTLNNAGIGAYSRTDAGGSYSIMGTLSGSSYIYLSFKNGSNRISYWLNSSDFGSSAYTGPTTGFFSANRIAASGAGSENIYINGVYYNSLTSTSNALPSNVFTLLQVSAADYSIHQLSFAYVSSSLTASNLVNFNQRVEKYLMRYGKNKEVPVTTTLLSPTNGEDSLATTLDTLDWSDVFNADTYHLQVDDNSDFSSLTGEVTNLTNSRYIVGGTNPGAVGSASLDSNGIYYWRVRSTNTNGNSVWSSIFSFNTHSVFQTESIDLFARFPNGVGSIARKFTIDSLIIFLKADTIWSKTDLIYMYAAEDTGQAKVNWKNSSYTSTLNGSPTFTVNKGFTGNGTSSYINTNWIASTNGVQYQLDSASISIYSMDTGSIGNVVIGANNSSANYIRISPYTGGPYMSLAINSNTIDGNYAATSATIGLYTLSRTASNNYNVYKNDSLLISYSTTSSNKPTVPVYILANNANGGTNNWSNYKIAFVRLGNKLNTYSTHRLTDNIEWYLNRIGTAKVPLKPFLLSPASAVNVADSDTTLSWSALNNKSSYHLQVSTAANFGSFFKNDSGLTSTTYNLTGLSTATTYYWRVRAKNSAGIGAWSLTNNFTTNATLAATYYVDSLAGNDGNAGTTVGSPWKTLSKVQSYTFKYGDTIKFKAPYTYTGNIYKKDSIGTAQLTNISFDSYGSGKATILATDGLPAMTFISRLENILKVSVRNLKFEGTYITASQSGGHYWNSAILAQKKDSMATVVDSIGFVKVTNCEIKKFGWSGIDVALNDVRRNFSVKLDSNLIFDCGESGITGTGIWKPSTVIGNTIYNIRGRNGAWVTQFTLPLFMSYCKNITISRNLVYNSGHNAAYGSALIAVAGARNCILSYNETYGAIGYTADGDGLDLDNGSDSCIVEYNYSHNNDAAGLLISGNDYHWDAQSYRLEQYGDEWYLKDSSASDHNIVRYNIFKNNNRKLAYGDISFYSEVVGKNMKGNKIYNNTFIQSKKSGVTNASMIRYIGGGGYDSTRIMNNVFLGDSILFMKSDVDNSLHKVTTITNNIFWDSLNTYKNIYWNSSVITLASWFSTYGYESSGGTALQYNPFLKNPWTGRDTINNPYKLDTLSAYKKIYGPSVITDLGRNFDSLYAYSLTNYVLGTKDFYGNNLKLNNKYDIGAYEDTATYVWQDTTKYWTGAITRHFNSDTLVYYDSLILRLQQDSIMRDTRLLYMFYAPDTALAYRSLKLEDTLATKSGGLTFTPYGGITNNGGTNSGLNLNLRPNSTDGIYTSVNSAFGILVTTNVIENNFDVGSYKISYPIAYWGLRTRYSSSPNQIINNHNNDWPQQAMLNNNDSSSKGFYLSSRFGSGDTLKTFKNGLLLDRTISKDSILPNYYITVGGIRYESPTISGNSNKNYASFWSGRGLSNYRQAKLNEHLNWFLTRIGKPNYTNAFRDASVIFSSGSKGFRQFPYTPVQYYNDTLRMYYFDDSTRIATSIDGINWTTKKTFTGGKYVKPYETIIRMDGSATNYRMLEHYWAGPGDSRPAHTRVYKSSDRGFTWSTTDTNSVLVGSSYVTGEDIGGIIYNSDSSKYNIYLRPYAPEDNNNTWEEYKGLRKISLIKTTDFNTFSSSYKPQLPVDTNQYYNPNSKDYHKGFYSMSVIKTASDEWWGFVNVLKLDDSTHDVYDLPPFNATDNTVEVQLVFSKDGENWIRCNDTLAIMPLRNGKKQVFGIPTIVGNEVWIYAFEAQFRHVLNDPLTASTYWEIWRYRMSIGDLRKFKKYY